MFAVAVILIIAALVSTCWLRATWRRWRAEADARVRQAREEAARVEAAAGRSAEAARMMADLTARQAAVRGQRGEAPRAKVVGLDARTDIITGLADLESATVLVYDPAVWER